MLVHNKKGWPKTKKTQRLFKRKGHQSLTIQIKMGRHAHIQSTLRFLQCLILGQMLTHIHSCGTVSTFLNVRATGYYISISWSSGQPFAEGPGTQVLLLWPCHLGSWKAERSQGYGAIRTEPDDSSDWVPFLKCTYISFHLKQRKPISFLPLHLETSLSGYN